MCLYAGNDVLVAEFVYNIQDVKLLGTAGLGSFFQTVQLLRLSAVDADADYIIIVGFLQPGNNGGGVQTAGISKNYFFFH